jgi:rSAM/selenodomain-associated transferase 2
MSVSVIIPTLNEASCIRQTLDSLKRQKPHEIIVADGGSSDATIHLADQADLVLSVRAGRAAQMNYGAEHASGDVLLFLHADCKLEDGALGEAEGLLANSSALVGCFTMRVEADGLLYRSIDFCANARTRLMGVVYGDQGMFLRKGDFQRFGGFPPLRLMEDIFFSRRLSRQGRIIIGQKRVFVSPRRWQRAGLLRQTLRNWTLTILAASGVHPDRLAQFYPAVR